MLSSFYYWKFKADVPLVTLILLTIILTYVETPIPTWCYSSTYPKDTLANYISC